MSGNNQRYLPEYMPEDRLVLPTADRVLLIRDESPDKSDVIIIPESAKTQALSGIVVALGPKVDQVELGDTVVFGQYSGSRVKIDRHIYVCIKQEDISVRVL